MKNTFGNKKPGNIFRRIKPERSKMQRRTNRSGSDFSVLLWMAGMILVVGMIYSAGLLLVQDRGDSRVSDSQELSESSSIFLSSADISESNHSDSSLESASVPLSVSSSMPFSSSYFSSAAESESVPLSNKKLSWSYTPGGQAGRPATVSEARREICQKYRGIWQGDTDIKKIYITMDLGYEYENNTTQILNIAQEKNFKINFFVTGSLFKTSEHKQLILRMYQEGHLVANHSWSHPSFPVLLDEKGEAEMLREMTLVEEAFHELTGFSMPKYFRPPNGEYSEAVMSLLYNHSYTTVFWSFAYRDWLTNDQPDPETAKELIFKNLHNGAILLLHTVSATNVEILPDLVDEFRKQGYEIALLNE
jgi:peptidoglycan-N-acetylmuramic acid deacetylase